MRLLAPPPFAPLGSPRLSTTRFRVRCHGIHPWGVLAHGLEHEDWTVLPPHFKPSENILSGPRGSSSIDALATIWRRVRRPRARRRGAARLRRGLRARKGGEPRGSEEDVRDGPRKARNRA